MDPIPRGMGAQEPLTCRMLLLRPFRSLWLIVMNVEIYSLLETAAD